MNKMSLLVGGICLMMNCAPAHSQGGSSSASTNNFKGLQNLVDSVNNGSTGGVSSDGGTGKRHKWKGGGGGFSSGSSADPSGAAGGSLGNPGSAIGQGAGPLGAGDGVTGGGKGRKNMDPAQREARRKQRMMRFDTNGDGVLDDAEKAKFQAFRAEKRAQRQAMMNGGAGAQGGAGGGLNGQGGFAGKRKHRHKMQDGLGDAQPGLPGGRRGNAGDFPSGFPGGQSTSSMPGSGSTP